MSDPRRFTFALTCIKDARPYIVTGLLPYFDQIMRALFRDYMNERISFRNNQDTINITSDFSWLRGRQHR